MSDRPWNCSVIAWGHPSDPRTFSGYSRYLTLALKQQGALRHEYSLKQLYWTDAFRGAFRLGWRAGRPHKEVSRRWMWSAGTSDLLRQRLVRLIRHTGDRGDFLQVGSLCSIDPALGRHCVLADMTIAQAHRAGRFRVGELRPGDLHQAIEVQRRVLLDAAHVFTLTQWARQSMIDDYGVHPRNVTAVYMGSNLVLPADLSVQLKPHQILFVGIDWQRKGGPQLVEGFRLLRQRLPDAELVVVGCTPRLDCPGVRVIGYLHPEQEADRRKLAALYLESACFALMSDFEPLGNVLIEAYGVGLPIVAYDSGSRREIIRDGESGVLCSDREPATIADALYRVLSDDALRQAMSQRARQLVATQFNWDLVVQRIRHALALPAGGRIQTAPQPLRSMPLAAEVHA